MATYVAGSNVQADTIQTLYLMNPGCPGYANSSNLSNIVLNGSTTRDVDHENLPHLPRQPQQQEHCIRFSLPSDLTHSRLSEQSHMSAMLNSNMQHQDPSSNASCVNGNGYSWNGGHELMFIPSNDVSDDHQSLPARHNSVNSGEQSRSGMPRYGAGNFSQSFLQEQVPLVPNGIPLGLNMHNLQSSTGAGQILSLSLSSQPPSMIPVQSFHLQHNESAVSSCQRFSGAGVENNSSKGDRFPNKCFEGGLDSFGTPRESMPGTGFQNQLNGAGNNRHINITLGGYGSRYLKAAQELLNEVVSVGRSFKNSSSKHAKLQYWAGPDSTCEASFPKDRNLAETTESDRAPVGSWSTGKDSKVTVAALHATVRGIPEQNFENAAELPPAEMQELQMKKAKLMAMLDEVDRRYNQYYNQMQIVVVSFESAAGLGAARTYTALALQTISKHIRCLRDAISGQLHATSRALGEGEVSGQGQGDIARLCFVDQRLQQQRALQQLGVMQQHAWRPQRGLPERSVSILRAWMFEHFLHPYPKDADKMILARQTGLSRSQVSNWFINARVRLWKPMVEEMYMEELKEAGTEGAGKLGFDKGEVHKGAGRLMDGAGQSDMINTLKQSKVSEPDNNEGFLEAKKASDHALQSRYISSPSSDSFLIHEKEDTRQGLKKAKIGVEDSVSLVSPNSSTAVDTKFDETHGEYVAGHDIKTKTQDKYREHYSIHQSGSGQANYQNLGGVHGSGLNRYSQEGSAASNAANNGVSLTLGLNHFEGLSQAQQHYVQGQGQQLTGQLAEGGGWFS